VSDEKTQGEVLEQVYREACSLRVFKDAPVSPSSLLAVAAHVRTEDRVRGGTLSPEDVDELAWNYGGPGPNHFNIRRLLAHAAAQGRRIATLEKERDEAVEWIGVMRDELVRAGGKGGDRAVALDNLRTLICDRDEANRLLAECRAAMTRAAEAHAQDTQRLEAELVSAREAALEEAKAVAKDVCFCMPDYEDPECNAHEVAARIDALKAKPAERMLPESVVLEVLGDVAGLQLAAYKDDAGAMPGDAPFLGAALRAALLRMGLEGA
jgi:hypothetical protein